MGKVVPKPNDSMLLKLESACRMLSEVKDFGDVKKIRDQAQAIQFYMREQGYALEAQQHAGTLKLRAERRLGELLLEGKPKGAQGAEQTRKSHDGTFGGRAQSLPEGVSKTQSFRWQQAAKIPKQVFEQHLEEAREKKQEVTTAGVLRLAKKLSPEIKPKPAFEMAAEANAIYGWLESRAQSWPEDMRYLLPGVLMNIASRLEVLLCKEKDKDT